MERQSTGGIGKISIKGAVGLFFVIAFLIVLLVAVPATRWLLALSIPTGVVIALVLRYINRER